MEPKSDLQKQIDAAAVHDDKGRVRGHLAIGPSDQLVILPPGTIGLDATVEKGVFITGLKEGWRLGTDADVKRKLDEERAADSERERISRDYVGHAETERAKEQVLRARAAGEQTKTAEPARRSTRAAESKTDTK